MGMTARKDACGMYDLVIVSGSRLIMVCAATPPISGGTVVRSGAAFLQQNFSHAAKTATNVAEDRRLERHGK